MDYTLTISVRDDKASRDPKEVRQHLLGAINTSLLRRLNDEDLYVNDLTVQVVVKP